MNANSSWPFGRVAADDPTAHAIAEADLSNYGSEPLVRELKRYLFLRRLAGRPITMQSKAVDEVWHRFILDLDEAFPTSYRDTFGEELPPLWTEDQLRAGAVLGDMFDHNCA